MTRGERPIKLRDSWFSAKSILVERLKNFFKGRALDKQWGLNSFTEFIETSNVNYNDFKQTDCEC